MGNFLNVIMMYVGVSIILGLCTFGITSVYAVSGVNTDSLYWGNAVFGSDNILGSRIDVNNNYAFSGYNSSSLPSSTYSGGSGGFNILDLIGTAVNWMTNTVRNLFNFVGAPYTFMVASGFDPRLSATIGGGLTIIFFVVATLFALGREN